MTLRLSRALRIFIIVGLSLSLLGFSYNEASAASGPLYIAHRGWSTKAPENSLAAIKLAAKNRHFYGVEFDVWEATSKNSEDPLLLVMHDENIKRMCGVSRNIHRISRKTLGKYTIKAGSNIKKYKGQKIPTSAEAIDAVYENSNGAIPVIELKERMSSRALAYLLRSLGGRKAVVISFNYSAVTDTVKMAKKMGIRGNIRTMYLKKSISAGKCSSMAKKLKKAGIDCISLKYTSVSKKHIKRFHKSGIKVCVWTIPNKKKARKYARMGVDYITANGAVY